MLAHLPLVPLRQGLMLRWLEGLSCWLMWLEGLWRMLGMDGPVWGSSRSIRCSNTGVHWSGSCWSGGNDRSSSDNDRGSNNDWSSGNYRSSWGTILILALSRQVVSQAAKFTAVASKLLGGRWCRWCRW